MTKLYVKPPTEQRLSRGRGSVIMMFHRHKPEVVAVQHGTFALVAGTGTTALFRCRCGKLTTESFNGRWTLEQLLGVDAPDPAEPVIRGRASRQIGGVVS